MFKPRVIEGLLSKPPDAILRVSSVSGRIVFILEPEGERIRFDRINMNWFRDAPLLADQEGEVAKMELCREGAFRSVASLRKEPGGWIGLENVSFAPGCTFTIFEANIFSLGDELRFFLRSAPPDFNLGQYLKERCFGEWWRWADQLGQATRYVVGDDIARSKEIPDPLFFEDVVQT